MGRCRFSPAAALFFAVLGPVIRAAWFARLSRLVVAAVAGARDWWRWWRRWQVAVAGGGGRWLVAVAGGWWPRWLALVSDG
jgi:hypothetical protein